MAYASDFTSIYSQAFADMFLLNYQGSSRLKGVVRELHGLVGSSYKLKYMDRVAMQEHGVFGADIPRTSVVTTAPEISFKDYQLKLVIDEFEQLNFNADALASYSQDHAKAIGRREDQMVIDAVVAGATKSVAAAGANMSVEKLREARALLGRDEVDSDEIYIVMHWDQMDALLGQTEYTSSIFNMAKPLVDPAGNNGPFSGFKIIVIGDRPKEGGLPKTGDVRTCIAFAKEAVTLGYRMDPKVTMTPVPQNARVETLSLLSAGAVVGDARGTVKILCDEA